MTPGALARVSARHSLITVSSATGRIVFDVQTAYDQDGNPTETANGDANALTGAYTRTFTDTTVTTDADDYSPALGSYVTVVESSSQTVTGTRTARFIAATPSATNCGSAIRQAPKRPSLTRSDGQPTLRLISS